MCRIQLGFAADKSASFLCLSSALNHQKKNELN
jgi:hypothetical protein